MNRSAPRFSPVGHGLLVAVVFLGLAALLARVAPPYLGAEWSHRLVGVLMGCLAVGYANVVPKALTPLARMRLNALDEQSLRRFCGWSLVLGGIGYIVAWLAAPLDEANLYALCLLGTAFLLLAARAAWVLSRSA